MKPPDNLLPKTRVNAVHYEIVDPNDGLYTIACGTALPPAGNMRTHRTRVSAEVTCKECWKIANPPESMFDRRQG